MNVETLLQTATSSTSSIKSSNRQTSIWSSDSSSSTSDDSSQQESFKAEMDKAFDKKNTNDTKSVDTSGKDKLTEKDAVKQEPEKDDSDTSSQEQLAAAQVQVQPVTEDNTVLSLTAEGQSEPIQFLVGQSTLNQANGLMEGVAQQVETSSEQVIPLPFQSSIDMVKAALLKDASQQTVVETTDQSQLTTMTSQETTGSDASSSKSGQDQLLSDGQTDTSDTKNTEMPQIAVKPDNLDPTKVNIKVADAPVNTTQTNAAEQIADKITYNIDEGKQEFDLQLNPKELGKLNIKLTFENGNAQVLITCSNSKAQNLIASLTDNIRGIIEANTGMTSTIHLQQEDMLQGQYDQDNYDREGNANQNTSQQEEKDQNANDLSFIDRLRLGLIDGLEEAV